MKKARIDIEFNGDADSETITVVARESAETIMRNGMKHGVIAVHYRPVEKVGTIAAAPPPSPDPS